MDLSIKLLIAIEGLIYFVLFVLSGSIGKEYNQCFERIKHIEMKCKIKIFC